MNEENEEVQNTFADMAEHCRKSERALRWVVAALSIWAIGTGIILLLGP